MKSLKKPDLLAKDIFLKCISTMHEDDLKVRLDSCANLVEKETVDFENKKIHCQLHEIPSIKVTKLTKDKLLVDGKVTVEEMKNVYTNKFAALDSAGRPIYDLIFNSTKLGICPICSHRSVKTLDHYLPKANYPILAVSPSNLVPSCYECNFDKKTNTSYAPSSPEEELLHPYFDNIEKEQWLFAKVEHLSPPVVVFYVKGSSSWSDLLTKRVEYNFKALLLNDLYSTQAAFMLTNIYFAVKKRFSQGGTDAVKGFLFENEETYRFANINSWQSVFYNALGNDEWFCSGGFNSIKQDEL